jgi:hypothetical protein
MVRKNNHGGAETQSFYWAQRMQSVLRTQGIFLSRKAERKITGTAPLELPLCNAPRYASFKLRSNGLFFRIQWPEKITTETRSTKFFIQYSVCRAY